MTQPQVIWGKTYNTCWSSYCQS